MDFTLSDEQQLLRDTARQLLARECPMSMVRAHIDDPSAADALSSRLSDFHALGDGPLVDLCLFLEACGAALAPGPFLPTVLALSLLRPVDGPLADRIAAGEATATVAMAGADGVWRPNEDQAKTFVLEADRVDHIAVVNGRGEIALIDGASASVRAVGSVDLTRRVFEVGHEGATFAGNALTGPALTGPALTGPATVDGWLERATVAVAAELVGTARWLLDASVAYAKERVQFDRPIGSFQAIQHKLADVALDVERAWSAVCYAAMAIDSDDADRHRATHVAKAAAGEAATRAAKDGIQTHGGIGYTWDADVHLYLRRAYASEHLLGTTSWHHDRLADLLLN